MSLAWEGTHRRYDVVQAVLAEVARTGRGEIPTALTSEIDELYGDFASFVRDLHRRWNLIFDTRLDFLLENPPPDVDRAIANLRHDLAVEHPAMRRLLDAHPDPTAVDVHATRRVS